MTDIVVLAEEPSARIIAEHLARKLGLQERTLCLEHQGKTDLERSFPRKIASWGAARPPRFIVMRDNDGADCRRLKRQLGELVPVGALQRVQIRIVIQELESWYIGDLDAVRDAGLVSEDMLGRHKRKARLRNPDEIRHAKQIFKTQIAAGGQIELARSIGPHLSLADNRSRSFHAFVGALRWAANESATP
jgi:hypothetical protein